MLREVQEATFILHNIDVENKDAEQLVVTDQVLYKCPNCCPLTLL